MSIKYSFDIIIGLYDKISDWVYYINEKIDHEKNKVNLIADLSNAPEINRTSVQGLLIDMIFFFMIA